MPTVKVRFPGGRYHATPWGHHVNEGLIEWPPSPWRLLRALVACGFSSQSWDEVPPTARGLIDKLAATLPLYKLPAASTAHTRHYMPITEGSAQKTTLVFDTWANVGAGELFVHWPCELDADERALLGQLVGTLGYLGRSESWIEAALINDDTIENLNWNAVPCETNSLGGPGFEQISLMAAIAPGDYRAWRAERGPASTQVAVKKGRGTPKLKPEKESPYPPDLVACMTRDTVWWKGHGWSQPPGSQRVLYWRSSEALQVGVPPAKQRPDAPRVECMLLAITSPSGNRSALPHIHRTLPQAELVRRALIRRAANGERIHCPSLLGKDDSGPLHDRHEHAHFLPLNLAGDQFLDHILIYAPGQLCSTAQEAIRTLRRTWTKGGVGDLQLALIGSGSLDSLRHQLDSSKLRIESVLGPPAGARVWQSTTPFVLPRFMKPNGKNTLEGQVQAELTARGLPIPERVELDLKLTKDLRRFTRVRHHGGVPPKVDMGFGLRLHFAEPVAGPILLGYASHFGLGLFRAVR